MDLVNVPGRKAVVLFTDGVDTTSRRADYITSIASVEEVDALFYPIRYNTQQRNGGAAPVANLYGVQLPPGVMVQLGRGQSDAEYWDFHQALFTSRGKVDKSVALAAAQDLGLSPVELELQMGSDSVAQTIQSSYEIAQALGITGTPTYIIGTEIIHGAIGVDELRARIADMRACGKSQCS